MNLKIELKTKMIFNTIYYGKIRFHGSKATLDLRRNEKESILNSIPNKFEYAGSLSRLASQSFQ